MPLRNPLLSMLLGCLAMFLFAFGYLALVDWMRAFSEPCALLMLISWLCNLDYVMFGVLGAPLYREHTCFEDGDYCDFKLKNSADPLPYWPQVFRQDNPYK